MTNRNNNNFNGKTFTDLCCNTGSFRLAMEAVGAECVFASEPDKYARRMYETNFGTVPECNLTEIETDDIPDFDILCCGLPHETFSPDGFEDDIRYIVKGSVFYDVLRIIHDKLPEIIIFENVAKITIDGSLEIITEALQKEDYIVHYSTLNALDYGVPQNRNRMYIVAFHADIEFNKFSFPEPIELTKCVADILDPEENIPAELYVNADDMVMKNDVKFTKNKPVQMAYVRKNSQGERIYSIDACAISLTSNGGGRFSKTGGYLLGNKPRKLSARECARLMGFPDDYIITESNYMATRLFGNAAVVDVLQAIIDKIEYDI